MNHREREYWDQHVNGGEAAQFHNQTILLKFLGFLELALRKRDRTRPIPTNPTPMTHDFGGPKSQGRSCGNPS